MRATSMTSVYAYDAIQNIKGQQHWEILDYMRFAAREGVVSMTRKEIAKALKFETSTMSARVNELLHCGALVDVGTQRCSESGRMVGALSLPMLEGA